MAWYVILIIGAALVIGWLVLVTLRSSRGSLVGVWQGKTKDGAAITIQFEGEPKGGIYRQLVLQGDSRQREFGHWTVEKLTELHFLIMATDIKDHPRFGIDSKHYVAWVGADHVLIDGPDRSKWDLKRSASQADATFQDAFVS